MKKRVVVRQKRVGKWLYWAPRILSVLFILFLAMFSLDVFDSASSLGDILIGLFMHNIHSILLTILLIISWKREWVGGMVFTLFGLWYVSTIWLNASMDGFEWYMLSWSVIIAGPAFVVGILWFMNWRMRKD
jgi:hypothetical protein